MKSSMGLVAAMAFGFVAVGQALIQAEVNPVRKTLQLLTDLEAKITADGDREREAYEKYSEWCEGSAVDKGFEIKTAKADIETLKATIAKAKTDVSGAISKIEGLVSDISTNEADVKAATAVREKEHADFLSVEKELMESIDTLDRAIHILAKKLHGSELMQKEVNSKDTSNLVKIVSTLVDAAALSLHDKERLVALAQNAAGNSEDDADDELGAPTPAAYKRHSESILDVLEDLREKANTQLSEARKEEATARHNYDMLKQSLTDQMNADNKDLSEEKTAKASAAELTATSEGDLAETEKVLSDAEVALEHLSGSCKTAAADHEASMESLAEELKALSEAKKVIVNMSKGAEDEVYGPASLLQFSGSHRAAHLSTRADLANFEVVTLVRQLAKKERSAALNQLASRIASVMQHGTANGEDPFAKVKELITNMIERLEQEAGAEATQKAYCDKEMAATKAKVEELTASADGLTAKMDKQKAQSMSLKGEVTEKQAELAELLRSESTMDKVRKEEREVFVQKKVDLEQGLEGVRMALRLLREYYSNAEKDLPAALVQQNQAPPDVPTYHSKSSGAGSGIIGALEVIEEDFGRSLAQSQMDEDAAEADYQRITQENKVTKTVLESDIKYKTKEAASLEQAVNELAADRDAAQAELDAVLEYSQTIHNTCVAKPTTYEERKAMREAEIAGLKEALQILGGEAAMLQRKAKSLRGMSAHHVVAP